LLEQKVLLEQKGCSSRTDSETRFDNSVFKRSLVSILNDMCYMSIILWYYTGVALRFFSTMAKIMLYAFRTTAATSKSGYFTQPLIELCDTKARLPPLITH